MVEAAELICHVQEIPITAPVWILVHFGVVTPRITLYAGMTNTALRWDCASEVINGCSGPGRESWCAAICCQYVWITH